MSSLITVVEIAEQSQMKQAWAIRRLVFIEEQHVPEEIEMDADDSEALHALALDGSEPVGCGRMMEQARQRGFNRAVLHAQLTAEGFYLKNGYIPEGEVFEEAGIAHRRMSRDL